MAKSKRGRPTVEIILTPAERRQLESWVRRHSSAQALALRCRIILACADPERRSLKSSQRALEREPDPVRVDQDRR